MGANKNKQVNKRHLIMQSESMAANETNDDTNHPSSPPSSGPQQMSIDEYSDWHPIIHPYNPYNPYNPNSRGLFPTDVTTVDTLGLNSLHHAVQSYAEFSSASSSVAPRQCPQHFVESIVKSPWGKHACVQTTHDSLSTPLHLCCRSILPDGITKVIAEANPEAISMQDEEGDTPLHSAFRSGASDDVIKPLVELAYNHCQDEEDCAFAKFNDEGDSSLHTAISHEASEESVRLILDAHPQGILAVNSRFQSPLHIAAEYARYDIIEVMIQSHASIDSVESLLKMKDEAGLAPVVIMWNQVCNIYDKMNNDPELSLEILECISSLLLSAHCSGIDQSSSHSHEECDNSNSQVYKLLQTCICLGNNVVPGGYVSFLIKNHPGILRIPDSQGRLPLHLAAMKYQHQHQHQHGSNDVNGHVDAHDDQITQNYHLPMNQSFSSLKEFDSPDICDTPSRPESHHKTPCRQYGNMIKLLLDEYPPAAHVKDKAGKLPFHLGIEAGMPWDEIEDLLKIDPCVIRIKDTTTGLLPFMLAAQCPPYQSNQQVDTIFRLLQSSPDVIISLEEEEQQQQQPSDDDTMSLMPSPAKRRRM